MIVDGNANPCGQLSMAQHSSPVLVGIDDVHACLDVPVSDVEPGAAPAPETRVVCLVHAVRHAL